MRRRRRGSVGLVEAVAAYVAAVRNVNAELPDPYDPRRPGLLVEVLEPLGVDPVNCIRARRALRRGARWP